LIFCDGACEPVNPGGTATYGYVIKFPGRQEPIEGSGIVGRGTGMSNNVAEYQGFYAAVSHLLETPDVSGRDVRIMSDSKMMINQLNENWKVKRGLYMPYYAKAARVLRVLRVKVQSVTLEWIPRERNAEADALSKRSFISDFLNHGRSGPLSPFRYGRVDHNSYDDVESSIQMGGMQNE
jgi:ribonuclease HI